MFHFHSPFSFLLTVQYSTVQYSPPGPQTSPACQWALPGLCWGTHTPHQTWTTSYCTAPHFTALLCTGASSPAVKHEFNNIRFNDPHIQQPWIQQSWIQRPSYSTILGFNNLGFNDPHLQQSLDSTTLGFNNLEFNNLGFTVLALHAEACSNNRTFQTDQPEKLTRKVY